MDISEQRHGDVVVLRCTGRFEAGAPWMLPHVRELLGLGVQQIVLHLAEMPYLPSAGIGQVVAALKLVNKAGGVLVVVTRPDRTTAPPMPMNQVMDQFDTLDDALRFVREERSGGPREGGA